MQATQFKYKNHTITIAPTLLPLALGDDLPGYYCIIYDPAGEHLDIDSDCFLPIREDAIAYTKKIVDSITK